MNATAEKISLKRTHAFAKRVQRDELLRKAAFLTPRDSALLALHLRGDLCRRELAASQGMTPRQLRRRIDRIEQILSDPCYLLAARYSAGLPEKLQALARSHWLEGFSLRELAARHHATLHHIRQQLAAIRTRLLIAAESRGAKNILPQMDHDE